MNEETQLRGRSSSWRRHFTNGLSPVSIAILALATAIGVILYLYERTLPNLLFLGSVSSFVMAYVLRTAVEQFHLRNRIVVSLAFFFLFLSFCSLVGSWYVYDIAKSISPVPSIFVSTVFFLPFYLLRGNDLLGAYEARQSVSELGRADGPKNLSNDAESTGSLEH